MSVWTETTQDRGGVQVRRQNQADTVRGMRLKARSLRMQEESLRNVPLKTRTSLNKTDSSSVARSVCRKRNGGVAADTAEQCQRGVDLLLYCESCASPLRSLWEPKTAHQVMRSLLCLGTAQPPWTLEISRPPSPTPSACRPAAT
ncbi:unnamed protein product [Pleuronectes platessa]|uniref:Uncharacterized protein n=1 Tax=Pleuronectes platessa TaxID=8262 RepID=A0A9N7YD31_PLEPL|nr:unnamed protein product [Pleuronectes platessa]